MAKTPSSTVEKTTKTKDGEMTVKRAIADFKFAFEYKRKFMLQADNDFEFALGNQWDEEDREALKDVGVLPLTINKIRPIVRLMRGIESQNRSESKAFPEGSEDSIKAEIATRLLKNAMKMDEGNYKISEMFSDGIICGESWVEPYLDNDRSMIEADLGVRKSDYWAFCWDPNSREYDLSDAQYVDKITFDLTRDQILSIHPDAEDLLDESDGGSKIDFGSDYQRPDQSGADHQVIDYGKESDVGSSVREDVPTYDLLEHYYKKYVTKWFVVDSVVGKIVPAASKADAQRHADTFNRDPENPTVQVISRRIPEIWLMAVIGSIDEPVADGPAWSYPKWKSWPFFPYFAERTTVKLKYSNRDLAIQGITRDLRPLNQELNKRRTQELRHLNQSANSGWLTPENAWVDRDEVENLGSAPGVNLEYKVDIGKPERINPTPLSSGHSQLAAEHAEDMNQASGINPDLLAATEGGQDSGRAIALRQKQGLVMVQGFFDNLSRTKKCLAKFILSQLSEIYTVERAMRVCGDAFIQDNFQAPVMAPVVDPRTGQPVVDPSTGQPAMAPQMNPMTGQPQTQVDIKGAQQMFNEVLQDQELALYDVSVGETISQDTVQYANFLSLMDMAGKGIPIPPEVLVDESMIDSAQKAKIKSAIERASAAAQQPPAKKVGKPNG